MTYTHIKLLAPHDRANIEVGKPHKLHSPVGPLDSSYIGRIIDVVDNDGNHFPFMIPSDEIELCDEHGNT